MKNLLCTIKKYKESRGIALLFTVLLTTVLLLVALGIANVSYRELTFAREANDSYKAFFAADSGIECALYLDKPSATYVNGLFSPTLVGGFPTFPTCAGNNFAAYAQGTPYTPVAGQYCAFINFGGLGSSAQILVDKQEPNDGVTPCHALDAHGNPGTCTKVEVNGYNTTNMSTQNCSTPTVGSNIVTRSLRIRYDNP